jgi:hypothetical protein
MPRIPLFGIGQASKSPAVTAKQLTNIYCEQRPQGERSVMVAYGTPGLEAFVTLANSPIQGALEFPKNSIAFVVAGGVLWEVNSAGVATSRGSIYEAVGKVSMSHNGVQVMIVDGTRGYIWDTSVATFTIITSGGFPPNPQTCTFLGRRFIVSYADSGRMYWSNIDDGLTWDALNFGNAESNPDFTKAVYASNGQIAVFGSETCEFWTNSGIADPAFVALQGNASEWGIAAIRSISKYDNSFMCLMKNRMSQVMVAQMNGYLPKKMSTVDMDNIINGYSRVDDACSYSYMLGGHAMYVINFPTAGYSWLLDGSTGIWTNLKSYGLTRHRGELSFNLAGNIIVCDYATGALYKLKSTVMTDAGGVIEREVIGETVAQPGGEFFSVDTLRIDMETGVGLTSGQGSNPQVSLSVSRDKGKTFGPEMWKPMGKKGEYEARVEWHKLGTPRFFTPKIRITDPVNVVFVSAAINPED